LRFNEPVPVRQDGRVRLLEGVQQAINWIAYDLPLGAHAALQDAMKFLLLAAGTGVDEDVAAARQMPVAALETAGLAG
jgi:hypothetical protein